MDPKPLQFDPDIGCLAGPPEAFAAVRRALALAPASAVPWLKRLAVQPHLEDGFLRATVADLEALARVADRPDLWAFVKDNVQVSPHTGPREAAFEFAVGVAAAADPLGLAAYTARCPEKSWADRMALSNHVERARRTHQRFPTLDDLVAAAAHEIGSALPREVQPAPETMLEHFELEDAALTTYPDRDALARALALDLRKRNVHWAEGALKSTLAYALRYERAATPTSYSKDPTPYVFYVFLDMFYERLADAANITYGEKLTRLRRQVAGKAGSMRRTMKHLQSFVEE